ncbi:MAG: GNAT family N-acetyltransferase [Halobacteriota archaeon]
MRNTTPDDGSEGTADRTDRHGVVVVETESELEAAFEIRRRVFVDEQDVPLDMEYDQYDDVSADAVVHLLASERGEPIGTMRIRPATSAAAPGRSTVEQVAKFERVAVLKPNRGDGWGRLLLERAEQVADTQGYATVRLHAQTAVETFYRTLGYRTVSDVFEEAGIEHVRMTKRIDDR